MKKSLFLTFFFPPEKGGIQNYLYNICKRLPQDKVVVWANSRKQRPDVGSRMSEAGKRNFLDEDSLEESFDKKQNFKIFRKSYESPLRIIGLTFLHNLIVVKKIIKENNIEIIHCGHIHPMGLTAYFCKKFFNIPYIIYTHGTEILELKNALKIKRYFVKKVFKNAQNIIVTTEFMRNYLEENFELNKVSKNIAAEIEDRIVKIPPGVNSELFKPLDAKKLKEKFNLSGQKIILTCGRLVSRKGHELVLKSLPNIIKKIPNIKYWIVGSGPSEEKLKLIIRNLNLNNNVRIFNNIKDKDLNFYYNLCDVFVMPSREISEKKDVEGFGLVYLEANACGKPVIGGDCGGVGEAVIDNQNGILVNPNNVKELSDAVLKLLRDKKAAKEMGDFGRERVLNEFNWGKLVNEKLMNVLE